MTITSMRLQYAVMLTFMNTGHYNYVVLQSASVVNTIPI